MWLNNRRRSNNNISNYAKRLQQMTDYANSLSNPDRKEAAIEHVKAINEIILTLNVKKTIIYKNIKN